MASKTKGHRMASSKEKRDPQAVVEKVQKLVALAASAEEDEARTAAMQAVRLMTEHELVCIPRSYVEGVKEHVDAAIRDVRAKADRDKMIWGVLGFLLSKKF
jgi:Protein of unknown function (DUF2786)